MGFEAIFPGTLNVQIETEYCVLDDGEYQLSIDAHEYSEREWVKLKRCKLNELKCAIIRPSDHFWVPKFKKRIEIVGQHHFRSELGLSDNSEVSIEFQGNDDWWK
jgi:CTP-dependent riboflavin kinase